MTPRETDEKLAELYHALYRVEDKQASNDTSLLHAAGAEFSYQRRGRGHVRVADMDVAEATEILNAAVVAYEAEHGVSEFGYGAIETGRRGHTSVGQAKSALAKTGELAEERAGIENEILALEKTYTGWSRFFLVTSSAGHIHSSMHCSTCRPTTRYGWLPQYSGKDEDEAVTELGPTLCTVCFPSAPIEWTEGKKLTKAQAEKLAA